MILFKNCRLIPELTEGFNFEAGSLADIWVSDNWVIESIEPCRCDKRGGCAGGRRGRGNFASRIF